MTHHRSSRATSAERREARAFFVALARVIEHYRPAERDHYRHCKRASRSRHIYRDLRTLERILRRWLQAAQQVT